MGILNVTPDSFYASSRCQTDSVILRRAEQILAEGGKIIDVGGFSSRPGCVPVSEEEELKRVSHALYIIRKEFKDVLISVDTFRSNVAQVSVRDFEANIINDIYGGEGDDRMYETIASLGVPYILMHIKGRLENMTNDIHYDDIFSEVYSYFESKISLLNGLGIKDIILDPGFGFAKNVTQNYELMRKMSGFERLGLPILVGVSRKRMLWQLLDTTPEESLNATVALNALSLTKGANILRVHDVKAAVDTIKVYEALNNL